MKELIDNLPVGVLLEDFGEILASVRTMGISDVDEFARYYREYPDQIWSLWRRLRIDYVNKQGLKNCQFGSLEELVHYTHNPGLWPEGPDWVEYCIREIMTAWSATTPQVRQYTHRKGGKPRDSGYSFIARNVSIALNPQIYGPERPNPWPVLTVYTDRSKDLDWETHKVKLEKAQFMMELGDQVISPLVKPEN